MKKILALTLGALLVAAAVPALAESPITFKGYLKAFHETNVNYTRAVDKNQKDNDSFFTSKLQLAINFQASDEVTVHWVLRGPNYARWGTNGVGAGNAGNIYTRAIWGEINTDFGTFTAGRINAGYVSNVAGLSTLGYAPAYGGGEFLYNGIFDFGSPNDALAYSYDFGNGFGVNAFYAKDNNVKNAHAAPVAPALLEKDADRDRFGVEPYFKWDTGGAALEISYVRDVTGANVEKNYAVFFNPAFTQSFGDFALHFEGKAGFGETQYRGTPQKDKADGLGLYLDATYSYLAGKGDVTLAGWYVNGNKQNDTKSHNLVGVGDFYPFLVAYNYWTLGTGTYSSFVNQYYVGTSPINQDTLANHWVVSLLGNHNITDEIKINYGLGYFNLVNKIDPNGKKDLGFEVDLGLTWKLLDNVTFETQFGYFFNGDATKQDNKSAKDTYSWVNVLAFNF